MARSRRTNRRPVYEVTSAYTGPREGSPPRLRPRPTGSAGWAWGCLFLGSLICVGMCVLALVLTPIAFRQLPEELQQRIARRLPVMAVFLPTPDPALEALPTVDPARATAAAGLLDGTPMTDPTSVLGAIQTPTPPGPYTAPTLAPTFTPTSRPTATSEPLPARHHVGNIQREPQTWNNCGPANLVQGLRVLGVNHKQQEVAGWLKPNSRDGNVSPWQMAAYTNQFTPVRALVRVNGSLELLKRLVYAGFGVVIETGLYDRQDGQWLGHYVTVVGWDDLGEGKGGFLYGLDSLEDNGRDGKGVHEHYADLDERWKHFNRVYMVLYPPDQEWRVRDILGTAWDETQNAEEALQRALQEAQYNPNDPFAWFNAGSSFVSLGRWQEAAVHYDRARSAGKGLPWRMLWYQFGPFKAYYKVGDYTAVRDLANAVIQRSPYIEETFYYRGLAYAALGLVDQAMADLKHAASFNPNFYPAQAALAQLQSGVQPVPETL